MRCVSVHASPAISLLSIQEIAVKHATVSQYLKHKLRTIDLFQNGSKGKSVKHGGGKTSELCSNPWRINMCIVKDISDFAFFVFERT